MPWDIYMFDKKALYRSYREGTDGGLDVYRVFVPNNMTEDELPLAYSEFSHEDAHEWQWVGTVDTREHAREYARSIRDTVNAACADALDTEWGTGQYVSTAIQVPEADVHGIYNMQYIGGVPVQGIDPLPYIQEAQSLAEWKISREQDGGARVRGGPSGGHYAADGGGGGGPAAPGHALRPGDRTWLY